MQFLKLKTYQKHEVKASIETTGDEFLKIHLFENAGGTYTIEIEDIEESDLINQQVFLNRESADTSFEGYKSQYK